MFLKRQNFDRFHREYNKTIYIDVNVGASVMF